MAAFTTDRARLRLVQLSPRRQRLNWFHRAGWIFVSITNNGDVPVQCRLEAVDRACACRFEFAAPAKGLAGARSPALRLAAGETIEVGVRVLPPKRVLVGLWPRRYDCALTLTASTEPDAHQTVLAQFSWSPLFGLPAGVIALFLLCAFLLTWGPGLPPYPFNRSGLARSQLQPTPTRVQLLAQRAAGRPTAVAPQSAAPAPVLSSYDALFQAAARQHHFDWQLLARLAYLESRFDAEAVGAKGELGLMQIHPSTWQTWALKVGVTDPFDPQSNILVGTTYLAHIRDRLTREGYGEVKWMLAAYNWGPENLQQLFKSGGGWSEVPLKTRQYALRISQSRLSDAGPAATFGAWQPAARLCAGGDLPAGLHLSAGGSYTQTQTEAVGPPVCRIERGSCAYYHLVGNLDGSIIFQGEEEPPFDDEDILMHPAMVLPLSRLNALVQEEWSGAYQLRITDAYDSLLEHHLSQPDPNRRASLHFEGRAIDLTLWPRDLSQYGRLCMLAHCAGFGWVHNEGNHCHAAIQAESLCVRCAAY